MPIVPAELLGAGDVLAAMITPAVLISASGTLVLSTSNRLGRVVDRIRKLSDLAEGLPDGVATEDVVEKRSLIADQVRWLTQRLWLLQRTVITLYVAIGLLVASSLTVGLSTATNGGLGWAPVGFGLLGALALMVGAGMLVHEARLAVRGTLTELDHIRKVVERKTTMPVRLNEKPEGGRGES
jgi:hypothetical protein